MQATLRALFCCVLVFGACVLGLLLVAVSQMSWTPDRIVLLPNVLFRSSETEYKDAKLSL